jgi:glucokinase
MAISSVQDSTKPTQRFSERLFLGIDVGGTNVKVGLVDARGAVQAKAISATPSLKTPQRIVGHAIEFAHGQLAQLGRDISDLAAVGMAVPGVLDAEEYRLREVVNLPGWLDEPLMEILSAASQLPSAVVNDANAAAYAEHSVRGLQRLSLALVTLGTGIGCGVVVKGSPYGGDHGCAGELGHIAIRFGSDALPCTCGSRGHLESYAGASGVIARLRGELADLDPLQIPANLLADDLTPKEISEAAEQGFEPCRRVIHETAQLVGQAVGMLGQVIDPAVVLLGGAMTFGGPKSKMGEFFLQSVRDTVQETTLVQVGGNVIIDFASLGNDAGLLGAAMVAKQICEK